MSSSSAAAPRAAVRPEIQALRAVAIGCVVLYHFWPAALPAGFVGVDVFFVVSGFLITGLLLRDAERFGRVRLREFYVRRIRRILPAAMVVLTACGIATLLFVPRIEWRPFLQQVLSSALYVQNWHLARDSQIPGSADLESTPVQHFWSLSVEEQFYLLWPLLIIGAVWLAARFGRTRPAMAGAVLGAATLASFVHCVLLTAQDHNLAYFSTFARAWEFGVGGLLALVPAMAGERLRRTRALAAWVGLAAVAVAARTFTDHALFPGAIALVPVLGTAAVIWAGMPRAALSLAPVAELRPVQWFGDLSYSLYLWHWPIIMFTPYITGQPSHAPVMVLLLVLSIVVSAASKRWIEDPFRRSVPRERLRMPRARRAAVASVAAISAVVLLTSGVAGYAIEEPHGVACQRSDDRE
ncbi:acyltransferase [Agromyces sp. Marseille-P2726]|uniref:acyltransferase family protein n=1 Tax=Agromyces sp. Marseille-P2726 TaxID=2709132 RepID=UPI001570A1C2|nr:acyltransferase [Agromyces sp. Marseille-P2726]